MNKIYLSIAIITLTIQIIPAQEIKSVKIGSQIWMAKNLDIETEGSHLYEDNLELGRKYGRLYTWDAAKNSCPAGWKLPSETDWNELIVILGGENNAGKELKNGGTSGFNALLGGLSSPGNYRLMGFYGTFWSSSDYDKEHAWYFYITSNSPNITSTYFSKLYGFSVRCIKNKIDFK
jgi:uncharacterized protein (TIGR02145 family)